MGGKWPWKRENLTEIWKWPHVKLFNIVGLWVEQTSINQNRKKILKLWGKFNIILCVLNAISVTVAVFVNFSSTDIANSLFSLYPLTPLTLATFKVIEIERNRDSFKKAMDLIDELTRDVNNNPESSYLLRKRMVKIWKIFIISISLFIIMDTHWIMRPILMILIYSDWTQIFDEWPIFIDTGIKYSLTYIYQLYSISFFIYGYTIYDNLFFSISELILGHFSILENNLKNLNFKWKTNQLKQIAKSHIKLLEICYQLELSTRSVLIIQSIATILLSCVGLFIVIMCGDFITSAYLAAWTDGDETQKKILLNFMTITMSEVTFGGFMKIDLHTFIDVLKTTFSYFNFLLALEKNSKK